MPVQCWQAAAGTYSSPEIEIALEECSSLFINSIYKGDTYLGEQTLRGSSGKSLEGRRQRLWKDEWDRTILFSERVGTKML